MEKDIIYTALENLEKNANLVIKFDHKKNDNYDGVAVIESLNTTNFNVEVKRNLTFSKLPSIKNYFSLNNVIIVSDYIPKTMKEFLRKEKLSYIDIAGNAYIENENIFILIEKNKNIRNAFQTNNRAFSKSGLKVIFQLIINEDLINKSYRQIGKQSKVSIDTVGKVFKALLQQKYIIQLEEKNYKIAQKEKLISEWVTLFNKTLRPKLKQRRYKIKQNFEKISATCPADSLGGELGGELLSEYLIAESAIIYTESAFVDVMKKIELLPSEDGNVTLVEKFWHTAGADSALVHPLLIYADLLNDPKPRNIETADKIYEKYVKNII